MLVQISDRALRACCFNGQDVETVQVRDNEVDDEPERKPRELVINSDLLQNKEQLNYTILVPTTQGLQVILSYFYLI